MTAPAGLAALAERWGLAAPQVDRLGVVLETLERDSTSPTSVRGAAALDVHVADSLSGLELDCVRSARAVADLGAGAGFPGVVLAIALEGARVSLVESAGRKCDFLTRLCLSAGVANAAVVHARAEEWPAGIAANDLVVARALASLAVLCEYAAPLLELGGSLVAWKGAVDPREAEQGARAAASLGLESQGAVRSAPYAGSVAHHLHVYRKVAPTPPGFPRRAGLASRRPLGGDR